jgi:hypothetical protein
MAASGAPALVAELLGGGDAAVHAIEACIALCDAGSAGRAELSRCGAVGAAVGLLGRSSDADVLRPSCQLLSQLCSQCPRNAAAAVAAGCMPALARLLDSEDRLAALEAYGALTAVVMADGQLGTPAKVQAAAARVHAAAAAGAVDAAARLVARHGSGGGGESDVCLVLALPVIGAAVHCSGAVAERVAASGALSGAVALLRSADADLLRATLMFVHSAVETSPAADVASAALAFLHHAAALSAAAQRAVALDPAAAPALIEVLMAGPAGGGALSNSPYHAASVLGGMAKATLGRARAHGAPNAVAADVRRAGGVPRMVELLRATVVGVLPEGFWCSRRIWVVHALCALVIMDLEARPAALAAGAVPLLARVVSDVSARGDARPPECGLDGDRRLLNALDALAALGEVPQGGRAALAAQPGLAATATRILGAGLDGWLQPAHAECRDNVMGGAAGLLGAMLKSGDALGTAAASEVATAGGAPYLVRCGWAALRAGPCRQT